MNRTRGLTLIEVLIVTVMMVIILSAISGVVLTSFRHTDRVKASRVVRERDARFEDRLRSLIQSAFLSTVQTDTSSYFVGGDAASETEEGANGVAGGLTFTALSEKLPLEMLNSQDDFTTLNERFGPRGGMTEVSLALTPVGDAPVQNGLFYRHQTPSDGDNTQGGVENLLDPDIEQITFEFFDGTEWITGWDTQSQTEPRLPAAVRVTYNRTDEPEHIFVVRLIHSDVTPENPVTDGGTTQ